MKDPQNLNSDTYVVGIDNTSKKADLKDSYPEGTGLILSNDSDQAVFAYTSASASDTAVFPTSATVPKTGQVILPGGILTFSFNPSERYLYVIQATSGTGDLYISASEGI